MKYISLFTLLFIMSIINVQAQLCSGSLGDPVVKIDFGSGTSAHGAALGSGITSYTYTSADFPNDGSYTIESRTNTPQTWWTTTDHTGSGYMMVVNASLSITDYFYKKTVTGLCPDTTYEFAAWIMNLLRSVDNSTPNITFTIEAVDGTILSSYNTGNIPLAGSAVWNQYGFYFDTPAGIDTVVIRMRNNKAGAAPGNDIALDDITFRACGPTVTSVVNNNMATTVCENQVPQYTFSGSISAGVYATPSYQWQASTDNGATWADIAGQTTQNLTVQPPQTAGVYMYRMAAAQGTTITSVSCRVASNVITVTVKPGPQAPTVTVLPTDCGNPNGSIVINAPAGYSYSIDGINYQAGTSFSGLAENDYNVTAKDTTTGCVSAVTTVHVSVGSGFPNAPAVTVAAPATCADTNGSITITDIAAKYSFDNGATWTTGNTAILPPGNYWVKVQNASGCASSATAVTIPAATGFPILPSLLITQPGCTTVTGSILVTNIEAAYSFNNGLTWGTVNSITNLLPDTYVVLTKNSLGCVSPPATAIIAAYVNTEPLPVAVAQSFCVYNNASINNLVVSGTNIKWYATATGGAALPSNTPLQNRAYYVTQTITNCESNRVAVPVTILNIQAPIGSVSQQFCTTQNPTVALLQANGSSVQWYDAATGGNVLSSANALTGGRTYYASQTVSGCESQARLAVTVTVVSPTIPVHNVAHNLCDTGNDGTETIDLTIYTPEITVDAGSLFSFYTSASAAASATASGLISNPSAHAVLTGTTIVYVRIASADGCYQVVQLALTLINEPVIVMANTFTLCQNNPLIVFAGEGFDSYTWSTGVTNANNIVIAAAGNYWVTVTKITGDITCSATKNFTIILSNTATIASVEVNDWTYNNNSLEVYVSDNSIGDYQYSIDGVQYQQSNIFAGLEAGVYTVYVRDTNGCGRSSKEIYILNYPQFFTPNGDGVNDGWHVQFAVNEPGLLTHIYDRYGKLLAQLNYRESWDGTYNGHPLPSTDYWFVVTRINGKQYKGHFSMLR